MTDHVGLVSRLRFLEAGLVPFVAVSFLDAVCASGLVPTAVAPVLESWLHDLHRLCSDLRGAAIPAAVVPDLDPARPTRFMDFVDPRRAEGIGDGLFRAPRLGVDEAFLRYGKSGV